MRGLKVRKTHQGENKNWEGWPRDAGGVSMLGDKILLSVIGYFLRFSLLLAAV